MSGYIAGWNQPGCLPDRDEPLPTFDTFGEAVAYLAEQVERFWDDDYAEAGEITMMGPQSAQETAARQARSRVDAKWLDIHTELHNASPAHDDGTHAFAANAGGFAWFIEPAEED